MQQEQTKNKNKEENTTESEENTQNIKDFGMTDIQNSRGKIHCLSIVGQVEGHLLLPAQNKSTKYEHILPQLASIERNPKIKGVLILLNTESYTEVILIILNTIMLNLLDSLQNGNTKF